MTSSGTARFSRFSRSMALAARLAATRFPVTAALIVAFSVVANLAGQDIYVGRQVDLPWLLAALFSAAATAVVLRLFAEAHGLRPALTGTIPVIAAALSGLAVWFARDIGLFAPPLVLAITTAIPLAPYIGRPDDQRYWTFTLWTTVGVTLAFVSVLLFTLGLSAILAMIAFLFDVAFEGAVYEHIYITAGTLVGPLFALGRIPRGFEDTVAVDAQDRLAQGLRFLFDWVAAPLALVTAIILHLYAAKILILGEVPKNEIGWIVTFYAVLVLSFRIVVDPFIDDGAVTMKIFARAWALMLIVPASLLTYAASLRILSEGFTIERYYLALVALTIALVIAAQVARPLRGDIRVMSGIPLLLLALSSFGPWGVADTVGRSQTALLRLDLAETGSDAAGAGGGLEEPARLAALSRLDALEEVGEVDRVIELVPEERRAAVGARSAEGEADVHQALVEAFGLSGIGPGSSDEVYATFNAGRRIALNLSGFDLGLPEQYVDAPFAPAAGAEEGRRPSGNGDDGRMLALEGMDLVLRYAGVEDRFSLRPAVDALPLDSVASTPVDATSPTVVDLSSAAGRRARLTITSATVLIGSERRPLSVTVSVLLRRADWPAPTTALLGGEAEAGEAKPGGTVGEGPR